jgi:hypothetical protein
MLTIGAVLGSWVFGFWFGLFVLALPPPFSSPAFLRAVVLFRVGPSFGGLRVAAVARVMTFLVQLPPDQRARVLSGETPWPNELVADLGLVRASSTA